MPSENLPFRPDDVLVTEGDLVGVESDKDLAHLRADVEKSYKEPSVSEYVGQFLNTVMQVFSGGGAPDIFPGPDVDGDYVVLDEIRERALAFAENNSIPENERNQFADDAVKAFEDRRKELLKKKN